MPSAQAVSIMFCAARPASNEVARTGSHWPASGSVTMATTTGAVSRWAVKSPQAASSSRRRRSRSTTKRQGWACLALPAMRPAWRMRRNASSGMGRSS